MQSKDEEHFDEKEEQTMQTVKCLTTKQLKALAKPEFQANPDQFYPTKVFHKIGFSRAQCPKCSSYYWRKSENKQNCGDSNCTGSYQFIGNKEKFNNYEGNLTYSQAWKEFENCFTKQKVPCTSIERYPTVARWRNDVDYVAAGIFCFQPYCVTGELDPPANPLICPQFCVRFNDLDNIGLTGRHYSGFIMQGIQSFNYNNNNHYWKEEVVEFNYEWLTEHLKINPEEITFIEDVWAGGGNLGPSIEYFVGGLEVGNMVFIQYKTFPDGQREELDIKVIDTGIGLERIPWLINGSSTSYFDVFEESMKLFQSKIDLQVDTQIWEKLGPLSCLLNIDEVDDIDQTWQKIADQLEMDLVIVKKSIIPIKDMFIILDHTRTAFMIINDGSLPSNVGGGSNVRNIIRRVFAILKKNKWWDQIKFEGLIELFECHKKDLEKIYGPFQEYKSFSEIIRMELVRYENTDSSQKQKLEKLIKKNKVLSIDDWILAITSYGIPADSISQITNQAVPGNLYYEIALRQDQITKVAEPILYQTGHLPETVQTFYQSNELDRCEAKVLEVFANIKDNYRKNIVILDQTVFYPTSGGQMHDTGKLIDGDKEYHVIDVQKVGKCILHILKEEVDEMEGKQIVAQIDLDRRIVLRNHHSATHIVFASCRHVLGPHVWQAGAKKTIDNAHLDITHYNSISKEQEIEIENEANRIILSNKQINKYVIDKAEAEKQFGFKLYQGGIVPGNQLRVVNISETDVEACCGTHCDNTSQVGWVKIIKSSRISDGILRLYFVAGTVSMDRLNYENRLLNRLCEIWSINKPQVVSTAERFFKDYKKLTNENKDKDLKILDYQVGYCLVQQESKVVIISDQKNPTLYFGNLSKYAAKIKAKKSAVVFLGETFVFGLIGDKSVVNFGAMEGLLKKQCEKSVIKSQNKVEVVSMEGKKKNKQKVENIVQFSCIGEYDPVKVREVLLSELGFSSIDI